MAGPRILRGVEELALRVALEGETADPSVSVPAELKPVLRFTRLTKSARASIRRVLEEDESFRNRVAAAAVEEEVGRQGWLWLNRPDGWEREFDAGASDTSGGDDPVNTKLRRALNGAEAAVERLKLELVGATDARERAERRAADAERELAKLSAEISDLADALAEATEQRRSATRSMKSVEAERNAAREELNRLRRANIEAEAELAAARRSLSEGPGHPASPPHDPGRAVRERAAAEAMAAIEEAAAAADALQDALEGARRSLGGASGPEPRRGVRGSGTSGRDSGRLRRVRFPLGIVEGTTDAARYLLGMDDALVVVDGYNVARTAWSGVSMGEERERTVRLLEEVQSRYGSDVLVVFDGDDEASAPPASRWVKVTFSPTGTTADDVIVDVVRDEAERSSNRPVVVVTSDREIVEAVAARGASVISSALLLAARP